ncbi:hypothetical protein BDZ89DRAFT_1231009 [Hymenopellis radicata]|nr:hypothetical protein BDZ89DRAFT_1231009 [Hymenopellis radicata]
MVLSLDMAVRRTTEIGVSVERAWKVLVTICCTSVLCRGKYLEKSISSYKVNFILRMSGVLDYQLSKHQSNPETTDQAKWRHAWRGEERAGIVDTGWSGVRSRLGESSRRDGFREGRHTRVWEGKTESPRAAEDSGGGLTWTWTRIQTTHHVKGVGGWGEIGSDDGGSKQDARFPNPASQKDMYT